MYKLVPFVGLFVAACFVGFSAMQMNRTANVLQCGSPGPPGRARESQKKRPEPTADATPRWSRNNDRTDEPLHKVLIRVLTDLDDLLDTIHDPASFVAAKPKLLNRVRQHAELAKAHQNEGMTQFSKSAAKELEKAMNRHAESLLRADQAAPGVVKFFEKEVGPILNPK